MVFFLTSDFNDLIDFIDGKPCIIIYFNNLQMHQNLLHNQINPLKTNFARKFINLSRIRKLTRLHTAFVFSQEQRTGNHLTGQEISVLWAYFKTMHVALISLNFPQEKSSITTTYTKQSTNKISNKNYLQNMLMHKKLKLLEGIRSQKTKKKVPRKQQWIFEAAKFVTANKRWLLSGFTSWPRRRRIIWGLRNRNG